MQDHVGMANGVDSSLVGAAAAAGGLSADHGMHMAQGPTHRRHSRSSPPQQHQHQQQQHQDQQQQQEQQDGILALLSAALTQGVTDAVQQQHKQHNGNQNRQPAEAAPAAKKARTNSPPSAQAQPQAAASQGPPAAGSQASTLQLQQQQVQQMQDTFWRRALQGVQFYLGLNQQQQQGSVTSAWGGAGFPPLASLGAEEQHALKQLLEPVRQAEVAKARQLLARLQGLDSATTPAAEPAEPAATAAEPTAGAATGLPPSTGTSSGPGSPLAAALAAAAAAAAENDMSAALSMQDSTAAAAAAAGAAAAAAAVAAASAAAQQQEQPAEGQLPDGMAASWLMPPDSNMQAWSAAFMGPAANMYGMHAMNSTAYRLPAAGRKATNNTAAASQQAWAAASAAGAAGSAGSGSTQEGFSLRNPQFVGVYKSRRSEQGWRAQFSHANKVINLGTYDAADDAARVWNEAALLLRGEGTWLNPVEPPLPQGYVRGELHLSSQKAVTAVKAAVAAAGLPDAVAMGVKLVA